MALNIYFAVTQDTYRVFHTSCALRSEAARARGCPQHSRGPTRGSRLPPPGPDPPGAAPVGVSHLRPAAERPAAAGQRWRQALEAGAPPPPPPPLLPPEVPLGLAEPPRAARAGSARRAPPALWRGRGGRRPLRGDGEGNGVRTRHLTGRIASAGASPPPA